MLKKRISKNYYRSLSGAGATGQKRVNYANRRDQFASFAIFKKLLAKRPWLKRVAVFAVLILLMAGVSPLELIQKTIRAISGGSEVVNLYASRCYSINANELDEGWWSAGAATGTPDIGPDEGILEFTDENAAFYSSGKHEIVCGGFEMLEIASHSIIDTQITDTSSGQDTELASSTEAVADTTNDITNDVGTSSFETIIEDFGTNTDDRETGNSTSTDEIVDIDDPETEIVVASTSEEAVEIMEETGYNDEVIEVIEEEIPSTGSGRATEGTEVLLESTENFEIDVEIIEEEAVEVEVEVQAEEEITESVEKNTEATEEEVDEELSWLGRIIDSLSTVKARAQEIITEIIEKPADLGEFREARLKFSLALSEQMRVYPEEITEDTEESAETTENFIEITGGISSTSLIVDVGANTSTDDKDNGDGKTVIEEPEVVEVVEEGIELDVEIDTEVEEGGAEEEAEAVEVIENEEELVEVDVEVEDKVEGGGSEVEVGGIDDLVSFFKDNLGVETARAQADYEEAKIVIWYSLGAMNKLADSTDANGTESYQLWHKLDTLTGANLSNALNGGYFEYAADFITGWEDAENLEIKFEGVVESGQRIMAFLDSVWIEVEYESESELDKLKKRQRWEEALDFLSEQLVFSISEGGVLEFRYNKNEERIWDTLSEMVGLSNFWQEVDLSAELVDSRGQAVQGALVLIFKEDGEFSVHLDSTRTLKPGRYTIRFHIEDRSGDEVEIFDFSQDFEWGVLAMNFNKSVYAPGDTGYIQMAVLDELGHTVCGAAVELEITNLNLGDSMILSVAGGEVMLNPECGPQSITDKPDYWAYYEFGERGEYEIRLTAATDSGVKEISEIIEVKGSQPFVIERMGPTRIYPKADYAMRLRIEARQDFTGDIVEYTPPGFKISNMNLRLSADNNSGRDVFGPNYKYYEEAEDDEKKLIWQDVEILAGDELEIVYTFDAPNESPELYLLGPLAIGKGAAKDVLFKERRQWQIASDAVNKRARTVTFLAGTYSGGATSGQNTNTNQIFSAFNFRLAETGVDIKNAFIVFESQFEAYNVNGGNYTGYNLAFDACEETCSANAFSGTGRVLKDDNTVLAYSEAESNQTRLIIDVTSEAQLAAYIGAGAEMEAQIGYRLESDTNVSSIASAKAILVLTYIYDADSESITNTVVYPLGSSDTAPTPADSGSKQAELVGDCTKNLDCPLFDYKMEIPEWPGTATATNRVAQWFSAYMVNDRHGSSDIDVTVNIEGTDTDSGNFHHESSDGSTQGNMAAMMFGSVAGFAENAAQQLEFVPVSPAANNDYDSIGGEVFETYIASSSAGVKTRTVSFPVGIVNNGQTIAQTLASASVYLPENGAGTVVIKKTWFRIIASNYNSGAYDTNVAAKVGGNATSSVYNYKYDAGGLIPKPSFNIIHIIASSDYAALEAASATNSVEVVLATQNDSAVTGGLSAELMITYTYTSEADGYLSSLRIFAGQTGTAPATSTTATTAPAVMPEPAGKTIRGASLLTSALNSDSSGDIAAGAVFYLGAGLSTGQPACAPGYVVEPDDINTFSEFYKDVTSGMNTSDGQVYNTCLVDDDTAVTTDGAKMNSILTYTYQWDNSPPTGAFITASTTEKRDGSVVIDIGIEINDPDGQDTRAKIEFATGTACVFSSPGDPTIDTADASITADFGDPDADNSAIYQIGTPSAYIQTAFGSNSVFFDWLAAGDLGEVEGDYCLRLTANDTRLDQAVAATTTVYIDALPPASPGALSLAGRTGATTTLYFGATTTETNFREYKIFYKIYDGADPAEADSVWASSSEANLGDILFNGAATTSIGNLSASTTYSFAIWAYDAYGNKASSTRVDITTNDAPAGEFNSAAEKTDGSGIVDISIEVDDLNNQDTLKAKLEYEAGAGCAFTSPLDPTLDEGAASIGADFGQPVINNNWEYQVGSSSGWILTSPGSNTVQFDWLARTDVPVADSAYCLRLTVNDRFDDQLAAATTTLTLDNVNPSSTGSLTAGTVTTNSVTLIYATNTPATDTNEPVINAYRIYYKQGTSGATRQDTEYDSGDFNAYDYGGSTSTVVTSLDQNTWYIFNIWSFDAYGNVATATEIALKTNATLSNDSFSFTNALSQGADSNIALAGTSTEWNFRAVVSETNGWYAISSTTLHLADKSDDSLPFEDLFFRWDQTTQSFSEVGADALNAVDLSANSTSTCAVNTCTIDFKLQFNKTFASSSREYDAQIMSDNDYGTLDIDYFTNIYQVRFPYMAQTHYRWRNDDGGE